MTTILTLSPDDARMRARLAAINEENVRRCQEKKPARFTPGMITQLENKAALDAELAQCGSKWATRVCRYWTGASHEAERNEETTVDRARAARR
jgi:hypothetical protein